MSSRKIEIVNPWSSSFIEIDPADITEEDLDNYAQLMDDELREELHLELAPCTPGEFLKAWADRVGPEEAGRIIKGS